MTFPDWLKEYADEVTQMQDFSKSSLPTDGPSIQKDLNYTTTYFPRCAELLADVEQFIILGRARETLSILTEKLYENCSAPERKVAVEGRMAQQIRTRDILKATCRALNERSYALLNFRNYVREEMRMAPHGEGA